jgi:hypothetical protein
MDDPWIGDCPVCYQNKRLIRFHPPFPNELSGNQSQGHSCFECIEHIVERKNDLNAYECRCRCDGYESAILICSEIIDHLIEISPSLPNNIKGINDLESYLPSVFEHSRVDDYNRIINIDKWDKTQFVTSSQEEQEDERRAANNNNNAGAGAAAAAAAEGTAANENFASSEQHEDNNNDAAAGGTAANENPASRQQPEDEELGAANNIFGGGGGGGGGAAAAGGTGAMLGVFAFEPNSDTSRLAVQPRSRFLLSEELAQSGPITFQIGDFEVTAMRRGQGRRSSRQRTQSSSQSTATARSPSRRPATAQSSRRVRPRQVLPLPHLPQNGSAVNGDLRWKALQVPEGQSEKCPFCDMQINSNYRSVLPCFDKINGTDNERRGIVRHHSSTLVTEGECQYYCWPYGIVTSRGFCDKLVESLQNQDSMNENETRDLIRFCVVGISFFDTDRFGEVINDIFATLDLNTRSDKRIMMEYIQGWGTVISDANKIKTDKNNMLRQMKGRFEQFLGEMKKEQIFPIIDEVRQLVLSLRTQVQQHEGDPIGSRALETIIKHWLYSSVVSNDVVTEIMKTSLAKTIFHRLDSIRLSSEIWRNRRVDTLNNS